jgi:archaellin
MNNKGSSPIALAILLISFILIGSTVSSVLSDGSEDISEEDIEDMVNTIVNEISTYLKIEDVYGEYSFVEGKHQIDKMVIMVTPLFSVDLNISDLMIKLCNGEEIKILYFGQNGEFIRDHSVFKHPLWGDTSFSNYSILILQDKDRSIIDYNVINDNTDSMYIIIKLPYGFMMKKDDIMTISFYISNGISRTINIKAPLPMKKIVTLW